MAADPDDATTQATGSSAPATPATPTGTRAPSEDEMAFHRYGVELADAVDGVLADWVERCVVTALVGQGMVVSAAVRAEALAAGRAARAEVVPRLRHLLAADVDAQGSGPLSILRDAVRYPTAVLLVAGATPVARDDFEVHAFPEDLFGLSPAAFGEVDERLTDPGLRWGAAKAYVHLARRRDEAS